MFALNLTLQNNNGILEDDPRLADFYSYLEEGLGATSSCDRALDIDQFARAISSCSTIVNRTVKGELRVPDMPGVAEVIQQGEAVALNCARHSLPPQC